MTEHMTQNVGSSKVKCETANAVELLWPIYHRLSCRNFIL